MVAEEGSHAAFDAFLDAFDFPLQPILIDPGAERHEEVAGPQQGAAKRPTRASERPLEPEDAEPEDALDVLSQSKHWQALCATPLDLAVRSDAMLRVRPIAALEGHCRAFYLDGMFEDDFLEGVEAFARELPGSTTSHNMAATRRFFRSEAVAEAILARLPEKLAFVRVLPDMRFIEYDVGGYIAPHQDGIKFDAKTGKQSTTSFLLYLKDTNEGGTTDFLSATTGEVLHSVVPRRGSILLFPHEALHEGTGVGADSKFLLRGDLL